MYSARSRMQVLMWRAQCLPLEASTRLLREEPLAITLIGADISVWVHLGLIAFPWLPNDIVTSYGGVRPVVAIALGLKVPMMSQ